jgi:DNA-binding CsgD family transcriptional regulator
MAILKSQIIQLPTEKNLLPNMQDYIFMSQSAQIAEFCLPLNRIGIDFFFYLRRDSNGTYLHLTSCIEWLSDFFKQRLYQHCVIHQQNIIDCSPSLLWQNIPLQDNVRNHLYNKFGINNVLTYSYQYEKCQEYFCFGSIKSSAEIMNTYINKFYLLQRFMLCFKNKYYPLIEKKLTLRVSLPAVKAKQEFLLKKTGSIISPFQQTLKLKRYYLIDQAMDRYLTHREVEILQLYLDGKTAVQISAILGMSSRTAEAHLMHIKEKTTCYSIAQLSVKYASLLSSNAHHFYAPVCQEG